VAAGAGLALAPHLGSCTATESRVRMRRSATEFSLGNDVLEATWTVADGRFRLAAVTDLTSGRRLEVGAAPFVVSLRGRAAPLSAGRMTIVGEPSYEPVAAREAASRIAERLDGGQVVLRLDDPDGRFRTTWRGIMRDGSCYVRQEVTLESLGGDVPIREVAMIDLVLPGAAVMGEVRGSPIVSGNWYVGFEHPLVECTVEDGRARSRLGRELPLRPGTTPTYSSVIGAVDPGQLRRGFLGYLERERAHPYRPFLHYNSWYDLGFFTPYDEAAALAVIEAYGTELHERRGVRLDSFLFDDGWDDPATLWSFHEGFPSGFRPLRDAAARHGAAPGVWMSPWGGYGDPREARVTHGRAQGFETIGDRFALSGPNYYQRFRETCLTMIRAYGVNQFKFDGTGNVDRVVAGSEFDSDFDAMIALIGDLRAEKPDLYVNLTTGTYPSPFFLRYADSTWRGGWDHSFAGVGSRRQQWITYRDGDTYRRVVRRGPLYPLNSLMLHGLIYARDAAADGAKHLSADPEGDFTDEIRSYFGSGTQLQEMYVTPALLTERNWDVLAEAANWARRSALTLVDTHWVGGDPMELEPYGWAAWSEQGATLVLRNPSETAQEIRIEPAEAFELPDRAAGPVLLHSPWADDADRPAVELEPGTPTALRLEPFEVVTLGTR
jgi:hypothetical protein